ncbi:MAG TPA: amino acid racemase [Phycisphaerae bacterium]|nr:amino acid racemase [Phycisphaerae bacterium]
MIGGMGPAATIRLYEQITRRTPIRREQDHLRLVIDSDPTVPDRTAALLAAANSDGKPSLPAADVEGSPERHLIAAARRLQAAGVELIAVACNTAHAWHDRIGSAVDVPVLHLIDVTADAAARRVGPGGQVGLLATLGTQAAGLYQHATARIGLDLVLPEPQTQQQVMEAIMQVKTGQTEPARVTIHRAGRQLVACGAAAVIVGCTDISVVLADGDLDVPVVDSTVALAERIIDLARTG